MYEIMRTLIAEIVHDEQTRKKNEITEVDRDVFMGVLRTITTEYNDLCDKRNDLLHGTWFVGYTDSSNPDASEFIIHRFTSTKTGLAHLELEKNAAELLALVRRCERTRDWISLVHGCLAFSGVGLKISETFAVTGRQWCRRHNGQLEPLREKPSQAHT